MNKTKDCREKHVDVRPFAYAISLIEGKWKMHILFWLWKKNVLRYSELKRALGNVTHKMLSNQLKELEHDGIIVRKEYPQVPPKVEYSLSEKGKSMMPILSSFCAWGKEHIPDEWNI
ncbi:winged helix-turn-helix transcriptional regulator [Clostridium paraputrificum]|uniref:winged helix-turn-helix transcriptional regulator n=1 Tax=Clostridium paraputrificum TaxID=29363 RepID=UPI00232E7AE7|nr:winged helix-turn-helix transcriptional regulator [Clostridium paraputrificum]MDB2104217.1 winged helix-turn-helix transcriptional regulator [Clostridium paraputrificum]